MCAQRLIGRFRNGVLEIEGQESTTTHSSDKEGLNGLLPKCVSWFFIVNCLIAI